ncbi:MAG: PepSY-like domain-containing protein [Planctomycetota bacterium]|jgi:uncharacterized membrane protein YkoI
MKCKHAKLVSTLVVFGVIACVVTYADRDNHKQPCLPAAVKAALDALYPNAEIEEAEVEEEGLKVYEVELEHNGQEVELTIAPDGTVVEAEIEVPIQDLPETVARAIAQAAEGATIKEANKEVAYAVVKLVMLEQPQTSYEAELSKDGAECEIEVADDGTILEQSKWEKDD